MAPGPDGAMVPQAKEHFCFTDGISEAMITAYEEWGEDRLIAAARSTTHRTAQEIVTALVASADRFTAGAAQNDDLSVVVLKVL